MSYSVIDGLVYLLSYFQFTIGVNFRETIWARLGGNPTFGVAYGPQFLKSPNAKFIFNTANFRRLLLVPNTNLT